ncbi:MAG TPA: choice-of-anchor D domain-containing protein [Candidatus Dormibacteraeota bacterium]|nr:choice-of-anchor D domain-containing protein [Candidatus Dormibacteraeota bacterium]
MRLPQSYRRSFSISLISLATVIVFAAMPLRAVAGAQQLQCSPSSLKFGVVALGQSESQLITLTNTGHTDVTVSAISASVSGFSVSGVNLPLTIAAGQSTTGNVIFAPTTEGWSGGKVTITSNASNASLRLDVSGSGAKSVALTAAPSSLSFGQLPVGGNATLPLVLTNTRNWKVTVTAFQAVGTGFSVNSPNVPYVLSGGQSVTLNVTFAPQFAGLTGGGIAVSGPNLNIPLTGTGTTTGTLTIAPTALNFGNVDVGNTTTQALTLGATSGSVTVSSASSNSSQFAIAGASFPLTINAGQSTAFNVVFAPTAGGSASGTLTLSSNASNSRMTESVTGTGIVPQHSVDLWWAPSTSPVAGYNVYRGTTSGAYSKVNTAVDPLTTYTDSTVASGVSYYYVATAVNSTGAESGYSSPIEVAVP